MFDSPDDDSQPDTPLLNGAMECYRLLLWLMPTCVAIMTLVCGTALTHWFPALSGHGRLLWLVINLAATIGLGIFRAKWDPSSRDGLAPRLDPVDVVIYVVIQIPLVPLLAHLIFMPLILIGVL